MITQGNHTLEEERENRSSAEIESGIRQRRERMDATLDELGNRLHPRSLVNSAFDWWEENRGHTPGGDAVKSTLHTLQTQIRANPVPSLLIGAGVAWLLLKSKDDDHGTLTRNYKSPSLYMGEGDHYTRSPLSTGLDRENEASDHQGLLSKAKEKAHEAGEAVSDMVGRVKEKAESLRDGAGEAGHHVRDYLSRGRESMSDTGYRLQHKYYSGRRHFEDAVEEYPLALGAAFAALGALTGVLLPHTRREDSLMGDKSRQLLESAKEKSGELLDRGKEVASRLADTALEEARQKGLTAESAGEKLAELAGKTGEVIRQVAEEASAKVTSTEIPAAAEHQPSGVEKQSPPAQPQPYRF